MNVETIDASVNHISQVTIPLGYQEPQILEVFKNTLPTKLYWVLFPIIDLRQVVETAKRVLTKEKIDRQLAAQKSLTPFMSIRDNLNKRVNFNTTDGIEQKLDKLTAMMGKLVTEDEGQSKQFKPWVRSDLEVITKVGLGLIMHIEVTQEAEQDIAQITEVVMVMIWEVIKDMGEIIKIEEVIIGIEVTIGIGSDVELDKIDDNSGDENLYKELIVNNVSKIENMLSQMEQWSILSNVINYVQYSKNPKNIHAMIIKPTNNKKLIREQRIRI